MPSASVNQRQIERLRQQLRDIAAKERVRQAEAAERATAKAIAKARKASGQPPLPELPPPPPKKRPEPTVYESRSSGVPGITWYAAGQTWQVAIRIAGRFTHMGYRKDLEAAIKVLETAKQRKVLVEAHAERARFYTQNQLPKQPQ
jgi:plasmid stabilization system protein ParE